MKPSIYNMFVQMPGTRNYAFMNCLTMWKGVVTEDVKKALESGDFSGMDRPTFDSIRNVGAIVDDEVDEKVIFKVVYNMDINDTEILELGVLPTLRCNLTCPFCYRLKEEDSARINGLNITDRVLRFAKRTMLQNKCRHLLLGLTGGEPLLVQDRSLRLVGELHSWCMQNGLGFQVMIGTNATLLTDEVIKAFSPYPVCFCTSLDGPKRINDVRRPYADGRGSYDDIIAALKKVKAANMLCRISTTLDKQNYYYMDEYLDELCSNGLQGATIVVGPTRGDIGTLAGRPPAWIQNHCFDGTELPSILPGIWRKMLDRGFKVHAFEGTFHENPGRRLQFLVGVYGDVYKSCGGVGSGKKELCIGNLDADGSLKYNYVYYQYQAFDPFADPKCRDCNVLPICQGKIDALGFGDDGMMYRGDCASFKELFAGTLLVYMEQEYPTVFGA